MGNEAGRGVRTEDYVAELTGLGDLREFVARDADKKILKVGPGQRPRMKYNPVSMLDCARVLPPTSALLPACQKQVPGARVKNAN